MRVEIVVDGLDSTLVQHIRRGAFAHARLDAYNRAPPLLTVRRLRPHHRIGFHCASTPLPCHGRFRQAGSGSMDFCSLRDSERAMSIFRGFARSASGIVTDRTPLSYDAAIRSVSTPSPSETWRR